MATDFSTYALTTRVREHRALIERVVSEVWPKLPDGADWIEIAALVGSGGNSRSISNSGGYGLLQVFEGMDVEHPFDPAENLRAGVVYLRYCYRKLVEVPEPFHRLLWTFAAHGGGPRGLGFVIAALRLSHEDGPAHEWWKWPLGKFWLMNRNCNVSYRYPDYRYIWNYVDTIVKLYAHKTHKKGTWARQGRARSCQ